MREIFDNFETIPTSHILYYNLCLAPGSKNLISKFVDCFTSPLSSDQQHEALAKDLHSDIPVELWEETLSRVHACSIDTRYRLIQHKVIHRLHYSKIKLNIIFPLVSPLCDRYGSPAASLAYLFRFCPQLYGFWTAIFRCFSERLLFQGQPDHNLAILNAPQTV